MNYFSTKTYIFKAKVIKQSLLSLLYNKKCTDYSKSQTLSKSTVQNVSNLYNYQTTTALPEKHK